MKTTLATLILTALAANAGAETLVVESNKPEGNTLLKYELKNGALLNPTEMSLGGRGFVDPSLALGPFDSDQQVITNKDCTLLFAINPGSNSIAVYHIGSHGMLKPVNGSPFSSGGIQPVSLGLAGDTLVVVNKHEDPAQKGDTSLPNYTSFKVRRDGTLVAVPRSTVTVAQGSSPSQALIAHGFVFGADFLGSTLQSFKLDQRALVQNAPMKSATPPLGMAAHPRRRLIYVGLPTVNKIAIYSYDENGDLKLENEIQDSQMVVCWLKTNAAGTRLYASNTASPGITVYDIATNPLEPREIQSLKLQSMGGSYEIALSPDERTFAVVTQRFMATTPQGAGNEIHVFKVGRDGRLGRASKTVLNLPMDVRPEGLAIF